MYAVRSAACNRQSAAWRVNRSHGKRRASGPDVMRSTGIASASATSAGVSNARSSLLASAITAIPRPCAASSLPPATRCHAPM